MEVLDWSADGRWILYDESDPDTNQDNRMVAVAGGATREVVRTPAEELLARFSPDGRWIAYTSNTAGRHEVFLRSLDGRGRTIQVSSGEAGRRAGALMAASSTS